MLAGSDQSAETHDPGERYQVFPVFYKSAARIIDHEIVPREKILFKQDNTVDPDGVLFHEQEVPDQILLIVRVCFPENSVPDDLLRHLLQSVLLKDMGGVIPNQYSIRL